MHTSVVQGSWSLLYAENIVEKKIQKIDEYSSNGIKIQKSTYTFAIIVAVRAFVLVHCNFVIALYHFLVRQAQALNFKPLLHTYRRVVKLHEIRQGFYNELAVQGMLCDRIIPQPQHFELGAILQAADFKEIRNLVLT